MKYAYKPTKRSDIKSYTGKDGKTFYASFLRVRNYDGSIKQVHKHGFPSFREAAEFITDTKTRHAGDSTVPLRVVVQEYMSSIESSGDFSAQTIDSKKSAIKHILHAFGDVSACDITPLKIRSWQKNLVDVKKKRPQSVNVYKGCLSCILQYAMLYYRLESNPAKSVPNLRVKESDRKKKNLWKDSDLQKALNSECNESLRVLWQLLYYSGLRIGEALGLTPSDIMEDGIMVRQQRTQKNVIKEPKKGSSGKVLLHPDMLAILKKYVKRTGIKTGTIFPYTYFAIRTFLRKLCKKASVPAISPHDLRHSSITNDANRGVPLIALQSKARHRNSSTTELYYVHPSDETQRMLLNFSYTIVKAENLSN